MEMIKSYKQIEADLQDAYSRRRQEAFDLAQSNKLKAISNRDFYNLQQIENEIIIRLYKEGENLDAKSKKELKASLESAKKAKSFLLKKMNLKESDLTANFKCKKCNDTGFVGEERCECFNEEMKYELLKAYNIDKSFLKGFSNSNPIVFEDKAQGVELEKLKTFLVGWAEQYPNVKKKNILICGATGVGKTFLSKCLAGKLIDRGVKTAFVSAFDMNNMMLKYHTTFGDAKNSFIEPLIYPDVLIIDDLGTEPIIKNVTENYLTLVLSERELKGKSTVITTNLMPGDILERYQERIYSRVMSKRNGQTFHLSGKDLRISK